MSYDLTGYGLNPLEFSSFALEVIRELLRNAGSKELMNIACTSMLCNGLLNCCAVNIVQLLSINDRHVVENVRYILDGYWFCVQ